MKPRLIVVLGPTASGKTSLSVKLAKKYNGEIISADSRQVYKGLDLGTGKIGKKEMGGIKHYLLDVVDPKNSFSVSDFQKTASLAINQIVRNKKIPIICGGTGFYIDALVNATTFPEVPPNDALRKRLDKKTTKELFKLLMKNDPKRGRAIDSKNKVRIIRALEIIDALGSVPKISNKKSAYDVLFIGLKLNDKNLRNRIKNRLEYRLKKGMLSETKKLHLQGLTYKRMTQLGLEYKYLSLFLRNKISKSEFKDKLTSAIWQYSKKQMTWFRRNKKIQWFNPSEKSSQTKIDTVVKKFLFH